MTCGKNVGMAKRQLRIVRNESAGVWGICEACNQQFTSMMPDLMEAEEDVKAQFAMHTCKSENVGQAAARIDREETTDS